MNAPNVYSKLFAIAKIRKQPKHLSTDDWINMWCHTYTHTHKHNIAYGCMLNHFSHVWLFAIPWTVACQASLSLGFSRQEYWRGLPFPSPGDLPDPRIKPTSLRSPALASRFFTTSANWEAYSVILCMNMC